MSGQGSGRLTMADMSHGLLVALLVHAGGHVDLPLTALEPDTMGPLDGSLYAVRMDPLPGEAGVRLSVIAVHKPGPPQYGPTGV